MSTAILATDGGVRMKTAVMPKGRAFAFARAIEHNSRFGATQVVVCPVDDSTAIVEYQPSSASKSRVVSEAKSRREKNADACASYKWLKIRDNGWICRTPKGMRYVVFTDRNTCSCPDFERMRAAGGQCKHLIYANRLEKGEAQI